MKRFWIAIVNGVMQHRTFSDDPEESRREWDEIAEEHVESTDVITSLRVVPITVHEDPMFTGLCDSNGREIRVGDRLKVACSNTEVHGEWALFDVALRGLTPIRSYVISEKGEIWPVGYEACILATDYDSKLFLFGKNLTNLRPTVQMEIIDNEQDGI